MNSYLSSYLFPSATLAASDPASATTSAPVVDSAGPKDLKPVAFSIPSLVRFRKYWALLVRMDDCGELWFQQHDLLRVFRLTQHKTSLSTMYSHLMRILDGKLYMNERAVLDMFKGPYLNVDQFPEQEFVQWLRSDVLPYIQRPGVGNVRRHTISSSSSETGDCDSGVPSSPPSRPSMSTVSPNVSPPQPSASQPSASQPSASQPSASQPSAPKPPVTQLTTSQLKELIQNAITPAVEATINNVLQPHVSAIQTIPRDNHRMLQSMVGTITTSFRNAMAAVRNEAIGAATHRPAAATAAAAASSTTAAASATTNSRLCNGIRMTLAIYHYHSKENTPFKHSSHYQHVYRYAQRQNQIARRLPDAELIFSSSEPEYMARFHAAINDLLRVGAVCLNYRIFATNLSPTELLRTFAEESVAGTSA